MEISKIVTVQLAIVIFSLVFLSSTAVGEYQSPRMQVQNGTLPKDVICQAGLHLIFKIKENSPICVKQETQTKLINRGWATATWSVSIPTDLNKVTIKLERTACFGACPIYSVSIFGDGTVHYEGIRFVQTNGTKTYEISSDEVKKLVIMIYGINYFSLNDRYDAEATDMPAAITTVMIDNEKKSIYNYGNAGPKTLEELEQKIDEITNSSILVGSQAQPTKPEPSSITDVVNGNNMFAFDMFSNLAAGKQENAFFSPYSISSAFSILYEGARGTTQDEIKSVFHFTQDDNMRRNYTHMIISSLNKPSPNYILNTANALWVQNDFTILPEYQKIASTYYLAKTENLDFKTHTEESRKTINSWVENKTRDKIKDLLPEGSLDDRTRAVITNAVYFLGNWTNQFNANVTQEDDFKISDKEAVKAPLMNLQKHFNYTSTSDLQILQIPYKGDDLSMLVLLPKNNDLQSVEKELSVENLNQWRTKMEDKEVNLYLPKFKLETGYSLVGNLGEMGMPTSFDPNSADFEGIDGKKDLYVTGVFHKAYVAVDEKGTEAAAATGIVITETSIEMPQETFRADHPFIFLIQDDKTGLILFLGKVIDPSKSQ